MKNLLVSVIAIATISLSSFGQAPEGFKYQAVVRNASNAILINQAVGLRMTIQQGSIGGTNVYQEIFADTTNAYGLVNSEIGTGTVVGLGTFANIDWSAGPYFMETAIDITGGTTYSVMGTSQLMSVPYALYAKTSGIVQGCGLAIGDTYQGGTIFYLDASGCHGLIAADSNQINGINGIRWYGGSMTITRARADGIGAGLKNTSIIIANQGPVDGGGFAATVCNEHSVTVGGVTYGDWYLPSIYELNLMYLNIGPGNALGLGNIGVFSTHYYWSSTELNVNYAWALSFDVGIPGNLLKSYSVRVRAVRAF